MKKCKSEALEVLHEMMNSIHKAGGISDERMHFYDEGCLAKPSLVGEHTPSKQSAGAGGVSAPMYARGK